MLATNYGSACHRRTNRLSTVLRVLAVSTAGLTFLLRCRTCAVFPNFISRSVRIAHTGRHLERIVAKLPQRLLRAAIRDTLARTARLQREVDSIWTALFTTITDVSVWNAIVTQKDNSFHYHHSVASSRLAKKFSILCPTVCYDPADICPPNFGQRPASQTSQFTELVGPATGSLENSDRELTGTLSSDFIAPDIGQTPVDRT